MTTKQIQCLLTYLGYDPGEIDGMDGPKTQAALEAFRADYGMGAEGLVAAVAGTAAKVERPQSQTGTFWDEIKYFRKSEFACKCGKYCNGYPVDIDMNMVKIADEIRNRIGKPIQINSGIRCKTHNANVGGVSNSQHLLGNAADLGCPSGCTPAQMASIAEEIMGDTGGIGVYQWGIHIDTRSTKSRWNG